MINKESIYELQRIDCNCNECYFMQRDMDRYKKWELFHRQLQEDEFTKIKEKAIADAKLSIDNAINDADRKSCEGVLRKALKMKFQFTRDGFINYGFCGKFDKPVSFIPGTCQIETQKCFIHRKDINDGQN